MPIVSLLLLHELPAICVSRSQQFKYGKDTDDGSIDDKDRICKDYDAGMLYRDIVDGAACAGTRYVATNAVVQFRACNNIPGHIVVHLECWRN